MLFFEGTIPTSSSNASLNDQKAESPPKEDINNGRHNDNLPTPLITPPIPPARSKPREAPSVPVGKGRVPPPLPPKPVSVFVCLCEAIFVQRQNMHDIEI